MKKKENANKEPVRATGALADSGESKALQWCGILIRLPAAAERIWECIAWIVENWF